VYENGKILAKNSIDLKKVIEDGKEFTDESFPPSSKSLFNNERTSRISKQEMAIWKEFTWERPSVIFKDKEVVMFREGIKPDDIL
jgi:hypothetical protein